MNRLALLATLAYAATASADDGAWHGFHSLGIADDQVKALGSAAVAGLREGGLVDELVTDDEAPRCLDNLPCYCTALRKRGLRYGVYGSLGRLGEAWTIQLTLIDAHACTVEGATYASEDLAEADVPAKITALARRVATPPTTLAATAVGQERPIDATPAIVTAFTRSQLRGLQIRSLEDLLPLVPGFDVIDSNWGGLILNQGLQNTLLFLSDGIPLVNGLNNFKTLDRDYRTSLTHFARIEIVRGPGSVLWGRNAFLGVVNLITEPPARREGAVEAGVSIGSLDSEEVWATASQNRKTYGFTASVDVGRRVGPRTHVVDSPQAVLGVAAPEFGNGGTTDPEPDTWIEVMLRFTIGKRLEAFFQNQTSDINYEISVRGPLLDAGQGGYWHKTHRLYALVANQPLREDDDERLMLRAQVSRYEYYSWENFAVQPLWPAGPAPGTGPFNLQAGLRSLQGNTDSRQANQVDLRALHDYVGAATNHITLGLGALHLHTPDSLATVTGIVQEPAMTKVSFSHKEFVTLSGFVLEEVSPLQGLGISVGARVQDDSQQDKTGATKWRLQATTQGGIAYERDPISAKLVYAQGFRPPDAVSQYSTVGTDGNPDLVPERSQELAGQVAVKVVPELVLRAGGNLTRISRLIVLEPVPQPSMFAYRPINKGRIDLASAFVEAQLVTGGAVDAFASYHITGLDESDPLGSGIPLARHGAALTALWRIAPDISAFARGSYASSRSLRVLTAADPAAPVTTKPTLRSTIGTTIANAIGPCTLDVFVDNPLFLVHESPYAVDGTVSPLVERRRATEVFATLRYER